MKEKQKKNYVSFHLTNEIGILKRQSSKTTIDTEILDLVFFKVLLQVKNRFIFSLTPNTLVSTTIQANLGLALTDGSW